MPEIFGSSVNREPPKRGGRFSRAVGALIARRALGVNPDPQVRQAESLPSQPRLDTEALRQATEQTAELRGQVGLAVRQFEEQLRTGTQKTNVELSKDPDRVTKTKEGIPILTSVMRATIRDPRRVTVGDNDSPRGLSSNPFMGEQSKVNHIGILRSTRVSTDSTRPFAEDKIALTAESVDQTPGETYGLGRVHSISFVPGSGGEEVIKVMESYKKRDGRSLPPQQIYPEPEQLRAFVDMISAAAMDSHPHEPLA